MLYANLKPSKVQQWYSDFANLYVSSHNGKLQISLNRFCPAKHVWKYPGTLVIIAFIFVLTFWPIRLNIVAWGLEVVILAATVISMSLLLKIYEINHI